MTAGRRDTLPAAGSGCVVDITRDLRYRLSVASDGARHNAPDQYKEVDP